MNTWLLQIFMTFPGLEMTILKSHDFSRFSMTVRTLYLLLLQHPEKKLHVDILVVGTVYSTDQWEAALNASCSAVTSAR